ncbi:hypothetical protein CLOM_g1260 [Closterium sp. NIES-68]|nr:hypothetical protein CLOM_g1260 [Closterium sp. NIES-68]GJP80810.1 hypothetical protein CLOP_g11009 [Closterium sp. NIES-67]
MSGAGSRGSVLATAEWLRPQAEAGAQFSTLKSTEDTQPAGRTPECVHSRLTSLQIGRPLLSWQAGSHQFWQPLSVN